eukprot:c15505_g1_i1.p1 GENE.c15505_g1_i1~~c15505_g1_i1.p1  ORF type:complete len:562 (-),score=141.61 c15505_g1_i1:44-1729(-)
MFANCLIPEPKRSKKKVKVEDKEVPATELQDTGPPKPFNLNDHKEFLKAIYRWGKQLDGWQPIRERVRYLKTKRDIDFDQHYYSYEKQCSRVMAEHDRSRSRRDNSEQNSADSDSGTGMGGTAFSSAGHSIVKTEVKEELADMDETDELVAGTKPPKQLVSDSFVLESEINPSFNSAKRFFNCVRIMAKVRSLGGVKNLPIFDEPSGQSVRARLATQIVPPTTNLPDWWKANIHDEGLLRGVMKYGLGHWNDIWKDESLPFEFLRPILGAKSARRKRGANEAEESSEAKGDLLPKESAMHVRIEHLYQIHFPQMSHVRRPSSRPRAKERNGKSSENRASFCNSTCATCSDPSKHSLPCVYSPHHPTEPKLRPHAEELATHHTSPLDSAAMAANLSVLRSLTARNPASLSGAQWSMPPVTMSTPRPSTMLQFLPFAQTLAPPTQTEHQASSTQDAFDESSDGEERDPTTTQTTPALGSTPFGLHHLPPQSQDVMLGMYGQGVAGLQQAQFGQHRLNNPHLMTRTPPPMRGVELMKPVGGDGLEETTQTSELDDLDDDCMEDD